jgi:hypothetical protein
MGYFCTHYQIDKDMCESISKISAILIMLILLGAFIVGYINEIISGGIEYILYCCGLPRPSRLVLNKSFKRFSIEKISDLRHKLQLPETGFIDNAKAAKGLAQAKQATEIDKYQEFYYQAVLARNLFFGHMFSSVLLTIIIGWSWTLYLSTLIIAALLCWQWWKMNLVYVKKIFIEYLK